jgi:hypothetical protein
MMEEAVSKSIGEEEEGRTNGCVVADEGEMLVDMENVRHTT